MDWFLYTVALFYCKLLYLTCFIHPLKHSHTSTFSTPKGILADIYTYSYSDECIGQQLGIQSLAQGYIQGSNQQPSKLLYLLHYNHLMSHCQDVRGTWRFPQMLHTLWWPYFYRIKLKFMKISQFVGRCNSH